MRHLPNIITILRILLVIPIMLLLAARQFTLVLWLFALAALSDGLDGYLARRYHWQSWLGALLDPLADKVMLIVVYLLLGWLSLLPWWLVVLVILRDVVILVGAVAYRLRCGELHMSPSAISKANTVMQMLLGLLVIIVASGPAFPAYLLQGLMVVVTITTLWSGLSYVWHWSRRAQACREA